MNLRVLRMPSEVDIQFNAEKPSQRSVLKEIVEQC